MGSDDLARRHWDVTNAVHSIVYWDPEPREEYDAIGLIGGWRQYFASRSAAMGAMVPEVVVATFFGFKPELVQKSLAGLWAQVSPAAVVDARLAGATRALKRRLSSIDARGVQELAEVAALARAVVTPLPVWARPLHAAHLCLPWPQEPVSQLWHASTIYREFRGDAHVVALISAGLDPCESLVLDAAFGNLPASFLKQNRGRTDQEWQAAEQRLHARELVVEDGSATADGRQLREEIEAATDDLVRRWLAREETLALVGRLSSLRSTGAF